MARYLEYDKSTGRIISELSSPKEPSLSDGLAILEISPDAELDTTLYIIKNGVLVKNFETNEERIERERLKKEQRQKVSKRIQNMVPQVCLCILENDETALNALRAEYKELKALMG